MPDLSELMRRILIIDDNEAIHDDFRKILSPRGTTQELDELEKMLFGEKIIDEDNISFDLDFAVQGEHGYDKVVSSIDNKTPYALTFIDMRMPPGWDGLETTEKIFKADEDIMIVICTAYSDYSWSDITKKIGYSDRLLILKKPFDKIEVIQLATALTKKWYLSKLSKQKHEELFIANQQLQKEIEDRKQAEREKDSMQKQMFNNSKLASLGTLAAGVAHEINNPLTFILYGADTMKEHFSNLGNMEMFSLSDKLENSTKRIAKIVKDLKIFARNNKEVVSNLDIRAVIENTVSIVEVIYKKEGVTIETFFNASKNTIKGNHDRFSQIVLNLLSNAKDALEKSDNRNIKIEITNRDGFIDMKVSDSGCGIAEDALDKIFDTFFTTKEAGKGTGLGLWIVHNIVESLNGKISVTSKLGQGTTFTVTLPISEDPSDHVEKANMNDVKSLSVLKGKVLLVDDELDIRQSIKHHLIKQGLEVIEAYDGESALKILQTTIFDFLITDIKMPNLDGKKLIKEARNIHGKNLKIIAMTGMLGSSETETNSLHFDSDVLIAKPFSMHEMTEHIKKLIADAT